MATLTAFAPTSTDVGFYRENGYLVLRQVFDPDEIADVAAEAEALLAEQRALIVTQNIRCRWQPHVSTGECLFETFDPIIDLSPGCARLALDARILNTLAALYGEPARLFKDKLIFKPPGAKGYDLHQDYIGWKDFPRSFLTVLVPLDGADRSNGCTVVYPGLHHQGYLSPEDGMYHSLTPDQVAGVPEVPLLLEPGDIAIFGCFTPHGSDWNRSVRWRRQLYLSYNAESDGGERRTEHYREFHVWLKERYAEYGKTDVYFR
jgi:2-aminoethylphosphonate dioxygenase